LFLNFLGCRNSPTLCHFFPKEATLCLRRMNVWSGRMKIRTRDLVLIGMLESILWFGSDASAIKDKDNQGRWNKPTVNNLPDKEVPGFLVNLGPTGARAILTENTFIIKYIFKGSPADGRLKIDDVITGIGAGTGKGSPVEARPKSNDVPTGPGKGSPADEQPKNDNVVRGGSGIPFSKHTFGGGPHGYEGPIMDLGLAIERAESKDGKLILNVERGREKLDVKIDLEPLGSFAPSFPLHCRKSELVRAKALKYLSDSTDAQAVWQTHARCAVTLALLSSENPQQQASGRKMALAWNSIPGPGTWTWNLSFQLITLSEYHLLTGDASVLSTIKTVGNLLRQAQYDGHIHIWEPKPGEDSATLEAHEQLYLGGFGHAPYTPGVGKNGYGPMQYTTIFAVIAWQLAERCGVKADPKGMKNALDFIHRGTNAAGYVAYGGEFTLNNGIIDSVAWKKSKDGDNYVGRAGASLIAHKLSTEFPNSLEYLDLNRGYLKKAYKSLPDGHADSNLGILWGILGAGASEDETALRTVLDYHKAWFNMMRCFDGSFVLLPGRDYADEGYYMASRYHPTATMALVLGLSFPKLQIQGIQVSIPGVNPKALTGSAQAAYKSIVARSYGEAARSLKGAGPESAPMSAYLTLQAQKVIDSLKVLDKAGRWNEIQQRLSELRKSHGGIAAYDEAAAGWDATLKGKSGGAILAADRLCNEGFHGKALLALQPALAPDGPPAARAVEERILAASRGAVAGWDGMEKAGEWSRLRKDIDLNRERFRGLSLVEERVQALDAQLASEAGRILVEADRRLSEGSCGPALKTLGSLDTEPARALRSRALDVCRQTMTELETFEKDGRWLSLKEGLAKARPKMSGIPAFDDRSRTWDEELATSPGRALATSEKLFLQGDLGAAAKALPASEPRAAEPLKRIETGAMSLMTPLADLQAKGDWYGVERLLVALRKKLAGVPSFDAKDTELQAALKADPAKSAVRLGAAFARLREAASGRATPALVKELEAFIQQAGESYYGREAKTLLKNVQK